jgi:hypothetical protein
MAHAQFMALLDGPPFYEMLQRSDQVFETVDPDRFYLENIRSFFDISSRTAQTICDIGIEKGLLTRQVNYLCPHPDCARVLLTCDALADPEMGVECEICEMSDRPHQFKIKGLRSMASYSTTPAV